MSELRKSINAYINNLVHKRFTKEELEKTLSEYFEFKVSVADITNGEDELTDYNLVFQMDFKYPTEHIYGYVDLYFLPTRVEGLIYITEVAIEFQ